MARKANPPADKVQQKEVGVLLRDLRKAAGFASVEKATETKGCPAARQTIYAYERGALSPSLVQYLDLVDFYTSHPGKDASPELQHLGVSAIVRALSLPMFHVKTAMALIERLQTGR